MIAVKAEKNFIQENDYFCTISFWTKYFFLFFLIVKQNFDFFLSTLQLFILYSINFLKNFQLKFVYNWIIFSSERFAYNFNWFKCSHTEKTIFIWIKKLFVFYYFFYKLSLFYSHRKIILFYSNESTFFKKLYFTIKKLRFVKYSPFQSKSSDWLHKFFLIVLKNSFFYTKLLFRFKENFLNFKENIFENIFKKVLF